MAVVLFAMGMYGCGYLGWRIRLSEDAGEVAVAQDLHPKVRGQPRSSYWFGLAHPPVFPAGPSLHLHLPTLLL